MQVASAAVITQAFPQPQHILFIGRRERGNIRKALQESLEVRLHGDNRCLLQHDLADPHLVRIATISPR